MGDLKDASLDKKPEGKMAAQNGKGFQTTSKAGDLTKIAEKAPKFLPKKGIGPSVRDLHQLQC